MTGRRRVDCVTVAGMVGILDNGLMAVLKRRAVLVVGAAMRRVDEKSCFLANIVTKVVDISAHQVITSSSKSRERETPSPGRNYMVEVNS